ncbi:hypothetical protein C7N43_38195 [Sphingobacteriales bacterium UPWRP_1]|nr:hypothetical protein BVG80_00105 [Sphingobacteriales bacterium TSM_CSM]PSJ71662.1 hypothetical protein C7N43_38195 [Sphingobacteriales bacterium UPWRP_1]
MFLVFKIKKVTQRAFNLLLSEKLDDYGLRQNWAGKVIYGGGSKSGQLFIAAKHCLCCAVTSAMGAGLFLESVF